MTTLAQWARPLNRIRIIGADIKLAHSVFALPFAVFAGVLAWPAERAPASLAAHLALIVACMVLARTWAMLINRIVDARFDRDNPRTAGRALPSGRLPLAWAIGTAAASAGLFVLATASFWALAQNIWPLLLSLPVLAWIAFYSLTKRWTVLCHVFLGGALAASPIAAAIAMDGFAGLTPTVWWLAVMVLLWVAGFDVIYALQDVAFDREARLHSVPAWLGWRRAAWVSRGLHALAAAALLLVLISDGRFGLIFAAGAAAAIGVLVAEHVVLAQRGERGLEMAFFTLNGFVSILIGTCGVLDLLTQGLRSGDFKIF